MFETAEHAFATEGSGAIKVRLGRTLKKTPLIFSPQVSEVPNASVEWPQKP